MSDCPLAHSDGAYVLGALSPTERLEFERHLPGCEQCRRSVAQLAGMPGLLARVPVDAVEDPLPEEPLPDTVLPALVRAVRREQRRKSVLLSLGAAAAVAAVALGVGALQASRDDGKAPDAAPVSSSTTAAPAPAPMHEMSVVGHDWGMRARVSLNQADWGTRVRLTCSYPKPEGDYTGGHTYRYKLVVFTRDGGRLDAMSWWAKPGSTLWNEPTTISAELQDITRVEVQSDEGKPLLRLIA